MTDMTMIQLAISSLLDVAQSLHAAAGDHIEAVELLRAAASGSAIMDQVKEWGVTPEALMRADHNYLASYRPLDRDRRSQDADKLRVAKRVLETYSVGA